MLNESSDIWLSVLAGSLLLFLLCIFIVAFTMIYLKKRQQYKIEKQQLQADFEQNLLQSQLEIQEQTFQHIAQELHDNLGQVASLIKINLNTIPDGEEANARPKIEETKSLIRQLIKDIKLLSVNLNGSRISQLGLHRGLEIEVDKLNKTGIFRTTLSTEGDFAKIDDQATVILFRMVQEMLNNIIKHSKAKHISISIRVTQNLFILEVADDGIGFDSETTLSKDGSGLINLKNRASLINAAISVNSQPAQGTKIIVEMPL